MAATSEGACDRKRGKGGAFAASRHQRHQSQSGNALLDFKQQRLIGRAAAVAARGAAAAGFWFIVFVL